jgi:hypothetical protein
MLIQQLLLRYKILQVAKLILRRFELQYHDDGNILML